MAETYCGKCCAECAQKEALNCPGCRPGPGRQVSGDCTLARCCRDKGHETCESCIFRGNCNKLMGREHVPEYRLKKVEAEAQEKAAIAQRTPILGKWLWVIFWLIIPSTIASLMTNDTIASYFPALYLPGQILNAAISIAYGVILIKLADLEERYRTAGRYGLIAGLVSAVLAIITGAGDPPAWTLLITLPAAIIAIIGEYNECLAHSAVLTGVNNNLSEEWLNLWKWYIGSYAAMLVSLLLVLIIPILGLLVILAASIVMIIIGILKLVYLYRTAKAFREYPQ